MSTSTSPDPDFTSPVIPPYTARNVRRFKELCAAHEIDAVSAARVLAFYRSEKEQMLKYEPALLATWRALCWRRKTPLEDVLGGAHPAHVHQLLTALIERRSQGVHHKAATTIARRLDDILAHPQIDLVWNDQVVDMVLSDLEERILASGADDEKIPAPTNQ